MKRLLANSRGDTIVEVLIAIVILALVLTGAYASSSTSFKNIVDAEQRIQALDVAQNQVEDLREQAATASFTTYRTISSCFQITANPATNNTPITYSSNPGGVCVSQGIYLSKISYVMASPDVTGINQYKINVTWPSVNGSTGSVVLYYRVAV